MNEKGEIEMNEKEEDIDTEEKKLKENEALITKYVPKSKKRANYKDIILLTDLDLFLKDRKIPFIFLTHIFSTILISIIIVGNNKNLNKLMQHSRTIQTYFYLREDTHSPTYDYPRDYFYTKYEAFSYNLGILIDRIFTINNSIDFYIYFENQDGIKMYPKYRKGLFINKTLPGYFEIKRKVNPLIEFFNNDTEKIKEYLSKVDELTIKLRYKYDRLDYGNCQMINVNLYFDASRVSYIKFRPIFEYENCDFNFDAIKRGFKESYSIFSILLTVIAILEEIFLLKKILSIVEIVLYIKENLSQENILADFTNEQLFLRTGETKWDLITNKDIFSLFPQWLFIFVFNGILNATGGISTVIMPFFNEFNRIIFGFAAFFNWISFAYYFHSFRKINLFNRTLFKSLYEYKFLLATFILLLTGFCLLNQNIFCHSNYYDGLQGTVATVFSATLGDILIDIWYSTFISNPMLTLILGFVMFVLFLGNHIRVMFTITQETFVLANLETKKSWLDKNYDYKDYLTEQFNINDFGKSRLTWGSGDKHKKDFAFDDAWMRAILNMDGMSKLEKIDLNNLKVKGLNMKVVVKYLKMLRKYNRKKKISKEIYKEIYDEEEGNIEMDKLDGKNTQIGRTFKNIEKMFYKMYLKVKNDPSNKERFIEICKQSLVTLKEIKDDL